MIVYSVKCEVDNSVANDWSQYFVEKHLDDVLNTGCFSGYSFRKEIALNPDKTIFVSEYYCPSLETMDKYNKNHADVLKSDIMNKFGGQFSATRNVFELINQKI